MSGRFKIGRPWRPIDPVCPIRDVRRSWGIISDVMETDECYFIEFDCGYERGNPQNIFVECIEKKDLKEDSPRVKFLDIRQNANGKANSRHNNKNEGLICRSDRSGKYMIRLPKICLEPRERGYDSIRIATDETGAKVYAVFAVGEGIYVYHNKTIRNDMRISCKELTLWLEKRFGFPKGKGGVLVFSDNLTPGNGYMYEIKKKES